MSDFGTRRILIIDDDEDLVTAIKTRLESLGYECLIAHNGEQGLAQFTGGIDLIITDLEMPHLDGVGLAKRLSACSNVPIIILSGMTKKYEHRLQGLCRVVTLRKPFTTEMLVDLVESEMARQCSTLPRAASGA